jgi:hypothetical protein
MLLKGHHECCGSSSLGLERFQKGTAKDNFSREWETFLLTTGSNVPLCQRDGISIRVQPPSVTKNVHKQGEEAVFPI